MTNRYRVDIPATISVYVNAKDEHDAINIVCDMSMNDYLDTHDDAIYYIYENMEAEIDD